MVRHLEDRGWRIVATNVRAGRSELDIVARRGRTLVVCEVRSRSSDRFGAPAESITAEKKQYLRRGAMRWLRTRTDLVGARLRFDVAGVVFDGPGGAPRLDYYEGAF